MTQGTATTEPARVLVLSLRRTHQNLNRCVAYEFEDLIAAMDGADIVSPELAEGVPSLSQRVLKTVAPWTDAEVVARRQLAPVTLRPEPYDLCIVTVESLHDLVDLSEDLTWRERSRFAICLVHELWDGDAPIAELERLRHFDHVLVHCSQSLEGYPGPTNQPRTYLPPGVDTLTFAPRAKDSARPIDVYCMGRRSAVLHEQLLAAARNDPAFFYVYDTIHAPTTSHPAGHRQMLANWIQRTQFFLVNRAKFNVEQLSSRQPEVGFRYFEGAAAGTVMLGERPALPVFDELFGWPDSVVPLAPDAPDLPAILGQLQADPDRVQALRTNNVTQSLRHHDWAYRWRDILTLADLPPRPALQARLDQIDQRLRAWS